MRDCRQNAILAFLAIAAGTSTLLLARTLSVDDDGPAEFQSIQAAIDAAVPGDVVSVAAGTYRENIELQSGVKVIGAGSGLSIIDGRRQGSVAILRDCDSSTRLQGFTLTGGEAETGAGVLVVGGAPIITLNHITGNSAVSRDAYVYSTGGGVTLYYSSASAQDNDIDGNDADYGGGVEIVGGEPVLSHSRITGNTALLGGGVDLYMATGGSPRVHSNIITNNEAESGAGIEATGFGTPIISNNRITGNVGLARGQFSAYGGGIDVVYSNARVVNNTIFGNQAEFGGGMAVLAISEAADIASNILYGNTGTSDSGGIDLLGLNTTVPNNIFFLNTDGSCGGPGGEPCNDNCGGFDALLCTEELTNLFEDPLLVDPVAGDLRLRAGSPAIDSARVAGSPDDDFRGQRRPLDGDGDLQAAPDRGAYEYDRNDVLGLRFLTSETLTWGAASGASSYHIYNGRLTALMAGGLDVCRDSDDGNRADLLFTEMQSPDPGDGVAYAVTAVIDGVEQSPGFDSLGIERSLPQPCP